MELTQEMLLGRRQQLMQAREMYITQAKNCDGAMQLIDEMIEHMNAEPEPEVEVDAGEESNIINLADEKKRRNARKSKPKSEEPENAG